MAVEARNTRKRRTTINDMLQEESSNLFVSVHATEKTGVSSHILLTLSNRNTGELLRPIEIPMTVAPYDLADYATKEDVLASSEFRRLVNMGILNLIPTEAALAILEEPDMQDEVERLQVEQIRRITPNSAEGMAEDQNFKAQMPPLPQASPGQLDKATMGVKPSVLHAMTASDMDDGHRAALLRNLLPTMTDVDKQYIRANTSDQRLRDIVG